MSAKLILAIICPWLIGMGFSIPAWSMIMIGILPWGIADWAARNSDLISIKQAFSLVLLVESIVAFCAICLFVFKGCKFSKNKLALKWHCAVLAPSLTAGLFLALRGANIEFPTDMFIYHNRNLSQDQLLSQAGREFLYNSRFNWHYSMQHFLWNLQNTYSINTSGKIAALNAFTALLASANLTWALTKRWELSWLCTLLFLIGFGHQNFSFAHQISLNGTLIGIAAILASATPLLLSLNKSDSKQKDIVLGSLLLICAGTISYKAHAVTAYFTANILIASWTVTCFTFNKKRIMRGLSLILSAAGLAVLNKMELHPNFVSVAKYPEYMKIVHRFKFLKYDFQIFWPALPNSTIEITFIACIVLSIVVIYCKYISEGAVKNSSLALSILPFIVLAEWVVPGINDLTFKLISPEVAYRIAWTTLFWISIPVLLQAISKFLESRFVNINNYLKASLAIFLVALGIPIHNGLESNILNSKVPHLLSPLETSSMADGSLIQRDLNLLNRLCKKLSPNSFTLSDPFIGEILTYRSECPRPLANRNYTSLSLESAESMYYAGLKEAMADESSLKQWLEDKSIGTIVLRKSHQNYTSEIGLNSRQWQADLVSSYQDLSLAKLNEHNLKRAGFTNIISTPNLLVFTQIIR
ncbi:hypothetical protein [Synechococcus sp. MVIR-18-1]|uniref:hypothetical protein n=1 Tax=Synechococcus sp. MVIR-18-1 TaxID=1386941 RepID=UPI00164884C5|nr:hypothetical protein [Synechococcus sp. MVIR-18-1]QNI75116.1 putative membrane protein [Synechococcus sp. MVIR-18-1]